MDTQPAERHDMAFHVHQRWRWSGSHPWAYCMAWRSMEGLDGSGRLCMGLETWVGVHSLI